MAQTRGSLAGASRTVPHLWSIQNLKTDIDSSLSVSDRGSLVVILRIQKEVRIRGIFDLTKGRNRKRVE